LSALAEFLAYKSISRERSGARQNEIAESGETHQRFDLRALTSREARDLSEPARDQGRNAV
jgi:hypothetical protein